MQSPAKGDTEAPVLIVGGAGLTASTLLGRQGVRRLLVSGRRQTAECRQQTDMLNQRATRMLETAGVAAAVKQYPGGCSIACAQPSTTAKTAAPARQLKEESQRVISRPAWHLDAAGGSEPGG